MIRLQEGSSVSNSPCKLVVGCSSTDELLLVRSVVLETFQSPLQVRHARQQQACRLMDSNGHQHLC